MNKIILILTFVFWNLLHIYFMWLNDILKVADSFAYLQMSNYFLDWNIKWFWTWWFGFLYSIPIAFIDFFVNNNFLSAQIVNIILLNLSWFLLYQIAKKYLDKKYLIILIFLFFISPILLHFNIAILSENIYISLFLIIVLLFQNFIANPKISDWIIFAFFIALMYYTRWEAFIYLGSVGLISLILLFRKKINFKFFMSFNIIIILFFWIFIFPYIYYIYSFTWEWWLSNKWSSNLRQAILRWKEKMDDQGFEKAVAELTPSSKYLISGFAGGLEYNKPTTWITLQSYILEDKERFLNNYLTNQKKLYLNNIPHIILGDWWKLYSNINSKFFYKNKIFLALLLTVLALFILWIFNLYKKKERDILIILFSFFFIASIFFTLFFTLNRYFIIFIPLFLLIIVYWIQTIDKNLSFTWTGFSKNSLNSNKISWHKILKIFLILNLISIYSLGLFSYFNSYKNKDAFYEIKKEAWIWLKENTTTNKDNLNILERFPIVTYYTNTNHRFITPYTSSLLDLLTYAKYNKIDYLIVDTLDFARYRPELLFLLDEKKDFKWLEKIKVFTKKLNWKLQKIIIYKIK